MNLISSHFHNSTHFQCTIARGSREIYGRLLIQSSPLIRDRQRFIKKSDRHFRRSDESAYSIVPSNMSSRLSVSTHQTRDRPSTIVERDMVYHHLSFEDDLFTSRVYKRNYRFPLLLKAKERGSSGTPSSTNVAKAVSGLDARIPSNSEELGPSLILGNHDHPGSDSSSKGRLLPHGMLILDTDQKKLAARYETYQLPKINVTCPLDEFKSKSTTRPYPGRWPKAHEGYLTVPFPDAIKWQNIEGHESDRLVKSRSYLPLAHRHLATVNDNFTRSRILNHRSKILVIACKKGDHVRVKELSDLGCNIHTQGTFPADFGFRAIHGAAMGGHHGIMQFLIQKGASMEDRTTLSGSTPLHLATQLGSIRVIELLLKSGALVATPNDLGEQPIHLAAKSGQVDVLRVLVNNGARLDCADDRGYQPLHHAVESSLTPEVIKILVLMGAEIDARPTGPFGDQPLDIACRRDNVAAVHVLLALGAGDGDQYESALYSAIKHGSLSSIKGLLGYGKILDGLDPKWIVAMKLLLSRLNLKLRSGTASANVTSLLAECSIQFASRDNVFDSRSKHTSLAECLFHAFPEDPNATNEWGYTALGEAIGERKRELSLCLLDTGARLLWKTDEYVMELQMMADRWLDKNFCHVSMRTLHEQISITQHNHRVLHNTVDDIRALGLRCFGRHVQARNGNVKRDRLLLSCPFLQSCDPREFKNGFNESGRLCEY